MSEQTKPLTEKILAALESRQKTTLQIRDEVDAPIIQVMAALRLLRNEGRIRLDDHNAWRLADRP